MDAEIERKRAYQRAWYHKNRVKRLADNKLYRQRNAESLAAKWKARYYADIEGSRGRALLSKRRWESMQFVPPVSFRNVRSLVALQRRLGGAHRGALSKSTEMGGSNHARREAIMLHALVTAETHEEWLEKVDLLRLAEASLVDQERADV
jgi:hypothetical protein